MDARTVIAALRRGEAPSAEGLRWFAAGLADGSVSAAQAGAFAMGVCLRGLSEENRVALTLAMRDSGHVMQWDLDGPVVDKHSTGGVGDCVSLVLAPALAACGLYVPMISGRGLGHTGGTLDKLDAIPGYAVDPDETRFREVVRAAGCAIVSASAGIAPADRRLYAVRDVTATVESLDLITSSILAKKLAAGLDALVLDVKVGSGAFMKTDADARALAGALVSTANAAGCPTTAFVTDMNQPIAPALGNALEVDAAMRVLAGREQGPLHALTLALGAPLLERAGIDAPEDRLRAVLASGEAAERMGRMVYGLGGPINFVEDWGRYLPEATVIREIPAPSAGHVAAIDGEALGLAVVRLGGGRTVETDRIDPAVGLSDVVRLGTWVEAGQPLARVHAAREDEAEAAIRVVQAAITLGAPVEAGPLIRERIG
ncbi:MULTISPECIES: thymidine phosphorylase [Salipiger]|jgi:thymidine phosphorylase|uniref:Thymidine phosphorylase n=1 Tax=Salipiger profundus TaxID=1229727 RepID=A0A1U7D161_9RHOB|nr:MULTISPECIES: thymidine phosphorylase [Salipiger]APX21848.1 thymidine phosphorylase [Salipiger profundus]GGA05745.1 thymidine phosphorylase [Salipiger profundus]